LPLWLRHRATSITSPPPSRQARVHVVDADSGALLLPLLVEAAARAPEATRTIVVGGGRRQQGRGPGIPSGWTPWGATRQPKRPVDLLTKRTSTLALLQHPHTQLDLSDGRRTAEASVLVFNPYAQPRTLRLAPWAPRGGGCALAARPAGAFQLLPGGSRAVTLVAERTRWSVVAAGGGGGGSAGSPGSPGVPLDCLVLVQDEAGDTTEEAWAVAVAGLGA
jgi:hypothetical protein